MRHHRPTTSINRPDLFGFTIIELMITLAIVAILAAIAFPQYLNYVNRAKMTEAFMIFGGMKTGVTEFFSQHGRLPLNSELGEIATSGQQSRFVRDIEINNLPGTPYNQTNNPGIRIIIKMEPSEFAGMNFQSNQMMFIADARGSGGVIAWSCGPRDVSGVKRAWLPASCSD